MKVFEQKLVKYVCNKTGMTELFNEYLDDGWVIVKFDATSSSSDNVTYFQIVALLEREKCLE